MSETKPPTPKQRTTRAARRAQRRDRILLSTHLLLCGAWVVVVAVGELAEPSWWAVGPVVPSEELLGAFATFGAMSALLLAILGFLSSIDPNSPAGKVLDRRPGRYLMRALTLSMLWWFVPAFIALADMFFVADGLAVVLTGAIGVASIEFGQALVVFVAFLWSRIRPIS